MLLQFPDPFSRYFKTFFALKRERLGDYCNRQNAHLTSHFCNNRRATCTRATTHTRGDEKHIRTAYSIRYPVAIFHRGSSTDFRVRACA